MFRYSATQWIYGNEDIEVSLKRLKKYGYDGVEFAGEPDGIDFEKTKSLLSKYDLCCTSICGIFNAERDLSSSNPVIRSNAIKYVKNCIDMAAVFGASHVIVVPSPVGKIEPETSVQEQWNLALQSVREAGEYALSKNINLAIEALNRYETYLVTNLNTALDFIRQVDVESVKIMADLFHMNIEERSHTEALKLISPYLIHVHIADNTREAAGIGQTDFKPVIETLFKNNYQGPITMEFLPPVSNPYLAAQNNGSSEIFDKYTEQSINEIKGIEEKLLKSLK